MFLRVQQWATLRPRALSPLCFPTAQVRCQIGFRRGQAISKGSIMTKARSGALEALRKLQEQRSQLDAREHELKRQAAAELGEILLECGAEQVPVAELKTLLKAVAKLGPKAAIERLG